MKTKYCSRCETRKLIACFSKNRSSKDGLGGWCKDCHRVYVRTYYQDHKQHLVTLNAQWRENNRERHLEIANKADKKFWSNPEKRDHFRPAQRRYSQAYRTRKRGLSATLISHEWEIILTVFSNQCAYCGTADAIAQDHVIPVTKGGGYDADNVLPACTSCNSSKCNHDLREWIQDEQRYEAINMSVGDALYEIHNG